MTLHLVKLCVGIAAVDGLAASRDRRLAAQRAAGIAEADLHTFHTTRMVPKRVDELLDGGSLYWVIKGVIQVRQRLMDIERFTGEDGIRRCRLILDPDLVETQRQPRRPFQGWRYLPEKDAPPDLAARGDSDLPPAMVHELAELGIL